MAIAPAPAAVTAPQFRTASSIENSPAKLSARAAFIWTIIFLAVGCGWRLLRYGLQFPFWEDEGFFLTSFLDKSYVDVLHGLNVNQVAPILFVWSELTVYYLLGGSELAMRLLPLLAGLAAPFVFWRLASISLNRTAALLAVGIFSLAYYPVRHACEVKPYSLDLLISTVLITLAVEWLRRPDRSVWLIMLSLFAVPALGFSNPAVFVAGGVSLALLPAVYRRGERISWALWLIYNAATAASFLGFYCITSAMHTATSLAALQTYWADAFPPIAPLAFLKWLASIHTGHLMAYPIGGKYGASTLTFLLFLVGSVFFWRRNRGLFLLCLIPFALTFLAAASHRYPYGLSARISQHLAPAICLTAGAGAAFLLNALSQIRFLRFRALWACCGILATIAVAGMILDIARPYKITMARDGRCIARDIINSTSEAEPIVLLNGVNNMHADIVWYFCHLHPNIKTLEQVKAAGDGNRMVTVFSSIHANPKKNKRFATKLEKDSWRVLRRETYARRLDTPRGMTEYLAVTWWQKTTQELP